MRYDAKYIMHVINLTVWSMEYLKYMADDAWAPYAWGASEA